MIILTNRPTRSDISQLLNIWSEMIFESDGHAHRERKRERVRERVREKERERERERKSYVLSSLSYIDHVMILLHIFCV